MLSDEYLIEGQQCESELKIFYMKSSVYGEVRSRESTRLIWTGTVLKVNKMFWEVAHIKKGDL